MQNLLLFSYKTFLEGLENESKSNVDATNDILPNDSYHYGGQMCKKKNLKCKPSPKWLVL